MWKTFLYVELYWKGPSSGRTDGQVEPAINIMWRSGFGTPCFILVGGRRRFRETRCLRFRDIFIEIMKAIRLSDTFKSHSPYGLLRETGRLHWECLLFWRTEPWCSARALQCCRNVCVYVCVWGNGKSRNLVSTTLQNILVFPFHVKQNDKYMSITVSTRYLPNFL